MNVQINMGHSPTTKNKGIMKRYGETGHSKNNKMRRQKEGRTDLVSW